MPRALARRIDRLAVHAHDCHRFAHHPLCDAYAGEVVRVGRRTRLCRGCLLGGLGALSGALVSLSRPGLLATSVCLALGASLLLAAERTRLPKVLSRFAPAALLVSAAGGGLLPATGASAVLVLMIAAYRRRGPNRSACEACPDRAAVPCPGLEVIVHRERAFARLAGRWLASEPRSSS